MRIHINKTNRTELTNKQNSNSNLGFDNEERLFISKGSGGQDVTLAGSSGSYDFNRVESRLT